MIEDHDRFSAHNPYLQVMWSPSSLGLYMRDPALYYLERVEGWRVDPPPINLVFGKVYHEALERYDRARLEGTDRETATHHAVQYAWSKALEPIQGWSLDDIASLSEKQAEQAKNTEGLIRSVVWYCDEHGGEDDLVQPIFVGDQPAVEIEFQIPLDIFSPYGEQYMIGGVLDGIVERDAQPEQRQRCTGPRIDPPDEHEAEPRDQNADVEVMRSEDRPIRNRLNQCHTLCSTVLIMSACGHGSAALLLAVRAFSVHETLH